MNFSPKPHSILTLLFISVFFLSCNKDDEPGLPDLRIYLDKFEEEAALRGYDFDLAAVEVAYVDEIKYGDQVLPYCGYGFNNHDGTGLRRIEILKSASCNWETLTEIQRENFMFFHIGSAFLGRSIIETTLCDGSPMSIMNPFDNYGLYQGIEKLEKRDYYLTELIDGSLGEACINWESAWSNDTAYYQYDPEEWWNLEDHDGDFIGLREGNETLSLELAPGRAASDGGKWFKTIYPDLPECSNVSFKVTLNSEGLTGTGAAVSLRVFERDPMTEFGAPVTYNETLYLTTTDNPVNGKLIDYQEELTIPCLSRDTWFIVLFVRLLPGTEGKIIYSDIRLVINE